MALVAFDTETHLIQAGLAAPPLVCASYAGPDGEYLLSADEARDVFRTLLKGDDVVVCANAPYDFGVMAADAERRGEDLMPLVIDKHHRGQVHDVLIGCALDCIYNGWYSRKGWIDPRTQAPIRKPDGSDAKRFSLEIALDVTLGRKDAKVRDFWRERYALLEPVPIADWPDDAREYPVDDARNTLAIACAQHGLLPRGDGITREIGNLAGMPRETRAALGLHLGAVWGMRTDHRWLERLAARVEELHARRTADFGEFFKREHERGCFRKAAKRGAAAPEIPEDCVSTCDFGKEDGPLVRRMVALAYGATGSCPACGGSGRRMNLKGTSEVSCLPRSFPGEKTCDGTGLDLASAPALPKTEGGGVSASRDTLKESADERLSAYGDDEFEKVRTTYVPYLRKGAHHPLCLDPNVLVSSFRTSYYGPFQQMPQAGEARVSFVARDGWYFSSCDYSGIELCTLSQVYLWLFRASPMADVINATGDPGSLHDEFGAKEILGITLDEFRRRKKLKEQFITDVRNLAKRCNFGLGGGMGAYKFVLTCRREATTMTGPDGTAYKGLRPCLIFGARRCGEVKVTQWGKMTGPPTCRKCIETVVPIIESWVRRWQMQRYFDYMTANADGLAQVLLPFAGAIRGGVGFTDGANGHFQGLAAILAKVALWQVTRECYALEDSVLYRTTRVPGFVHDELVSETMARVAHKTAPRVAALMVQAANEGFDWHPPVVPDVKVKVDPALSRRLVKAMEPAYDAAGDLIPWEDSEDGKTYLAKRGWDFAA